MIAYLDMPSGISGDIFLGCLVDAGWPVARLTDLVHRLNVPPDRWSIRAETVNRGALSATLVHVEIEEEPVHRHLPDIQALIEQTDLPARVKTQAIAVFTRLAVAEAAVHGTTVESVHFHEVGALDAIIDIVGVCTGLVELGVEQLYAGSFPLGEGWTRSAHGRIPLPAPATLHLLATAHAPTRPAPGLGELVTPTGAALVCTLAEFRQPEMLLQRIGTGAGQKEFDWPNVARLWLGDATVHGQSEPVEAAETGRLLVLETNIDDMNPELYAPVQDQLFAAGARDVWLTPVQMKKGRPGTLLSVLASPAQRAPLVDAILRETTTLGVRIYPVERYEADRQIVRIDTEFGPIRIKRKWVQGRLAGFKPEFEDCRLAAERHNCSLHDVYAAVNAAALATAA